MAGPGGPHISGYVKCFTIFMALLILIEGILYLCISLQGLIMRSCDRQVQDIIKHPLLFGFDMIYFSSAGCGDPTIELDGRSLILTVDWSKSEHVRQRELVLMATYAVLSGLWIATSLFILITICHSTTFAISVACYWPWFLVIMAGSVLDVVATYYHIQDFREITDLTNTLAYVGITMPTGEEANAIVYWLQQHIFLFEVPPLLLAIISSRLVAFWLLNIFGSLMCLILSHMLANQHTAQKLAERNAEGRDRRIADMPTAQRKYLNEFQQQHELRQTTPSLGGRTTDELPFRPMEHTYCTTDAHPDQLNYPTAPPSHTPDERCSSAGSMSPHVDADLTRQLGTASLLNSRYSEALGGVYLQQPGNRVSQELRSQLPWSYINASGGPPAVVGPRANKANLPQIPEPDYEYGQRN